MRCAFGVGEFLAADDEIDVLGLAAFMAIRPAPVFAGLQINDADAAPNVDEIGLLPLIRGEIVVEQAGMSARMICVEPAYSDGFGTAPIVVITARRSVK